MRALIFPAGRGGMAALVALALVGGPAAADPERRLEGVRRELDATAAEQSEARQRLRDARGGLETVDGRRRRAIADLHTVERRQAELAERVSAVDAELTTAQDTLATAEGRLADTTAALADRGAELEATEAELARQRDRFAARARAAYKRGGVGYASLALDLDDAAEFGRGLAYMERVIDHDRATVEEVADLQRQVEEQVVAIEGLRERQTAQRAVAERERDRLADVLAEQEALAEQVAAEAERHRRLVTELEADRDSYLVLVEDLEAESASLESELARLSEEEADAQEEVRRAERERAEAEERARAEAEERARRAAEEEKARRVAADSREPRTDGRQAGSRASRPSPTPAPESPRSPTKAPAPSASPPAPPSSGTGTARLARPVGGPVTSGFGYRTHPIHGDRRLHAGIDFGAPHGTPVAAAAGGRVVSAADRGGYGLAVVVDHGGGLTTLYAHLSSFAVSAGQQVSTGQTLGAVGSTGFSTGPHLHFEVRVNGQPRDPAGYL